MKINKNNIGYIAVIILLTVTSIFSVSLFFREKASSDKLSIARLPYRIGEWTGRDLPVTERDYAILETRNLVAREYANPSGNKIFLFIIYSETNRSVFHPPEVCMIGDGVTITDRKTEKIEKNDKYAFLTNKLYLEKNKSKEMVLYCYKAGNFYTDNYYFQQGYLALHQIFARRVGGATIRVSMPLHGNEQETTAVLKKFITETIKIVDKLT